MDTMSGHDAMDAVESRILAGGSAHPLLLGDPGVCHVVRRGRFDIFLVHNTRLDSRRRPLFSVGEGDALFSLPVPMEAHLGLLAVGSIDSELEIVDAAAPLNAARAETWIRELSMAISEAPPRDRALVLHPELDRCPAGSVLRGDPRAQRWMRLETGSVMLGEVDLVVDAGAFLPLAGALQAEALTDVTLSVETPETVHARDLDLFHEACRKALTIRFGAKPERADAAASGEAALDAGLREIARLSGGRGSASTPSDPLQAALHHLFTALAIAPRPRAFEHDARSAAALSDRLDSLLTRHRLFSRNVLLRPGWERQDGAPLLAWIDAERRPVALMCRRWSWFVLDGRAEFPADAAVRARLAPEAVQIYPSLPDEPFSFRHLFRFGFVGGGLDRARLVACLAAGAGFASLIPAASALLIDDVLPRGDGRTALLLIVGLFITILARIVFEAVKSIVLLRSELRLEMRLQPALIGRMMRLPSSFYRAYAVGDIMDRALGIQQARQMLAQNGLGAIVGSAFSVISLVPIVLVDWRLALVTLVAALVLGVVTAGLAYGELRHERRLIEQGGKLEGFVLQMLMGMAKLRASASEAMAFQRWSGLFRANLDHLIAAQRWAILQATVQTFLPQLATIAIYVAIVSIMQSDAEAAEAGGLASSFSAGAFVAVSVAAAQVFGSITALSAALSGTLSAIPLIERSKSIIATPVDEPTADAEPMELRGEIDIRNLSFSYSPSSPLALEELNLRIGAGEFVAVVGASGSGKSTLMRLLLGFEQPDSGDIFYDGTSMRRIALPDLRRQMGVVLQHGKLFAGSIHENITAQSGLGMDEAVAAARLVGLDRDIDAMPMGMHTVLLDGAATLSGGQRQRILIARALVGRPAVLLLDEATSALDNRTQAIVTETLTGLAVTRIAIAHRLSTIEAADRIVVMDKGRLVETGTYAELMALGGHFAAHARRQIL